MGSVIIAVVITLLVTAVVVYFVTTAYYKKVTEAKLSLIHISEPTRRTPISYAVFCLKKKT